MKKKDLDEDDFSRGLFCPRKTKVWVNYELPNGVKTSKSFNFVLAYGDEISLDVKFPEEIINEVRHQVVEEIRKQLMKYAIGEKNYSIITICEDRLELLLDKIEKGEE